MGGTGLSTGLAPAFTLGCGTMGGSSVSENVTPLHLINKKTVCYGIKEVTTMMQDDPTFHAGTTGYTSTPLSYSTGCTSYSGCDAQSPASFARASKEPAADSVNTSINGNIDLEQLKDMINGLVTAMKGE